VRELTPFEQVLKLLPKLTKEELTLVQKFLQEI
jgi:hypothetical protein